eukprot:TRINITY_DN2152_c0_g1_i1.p1 TRINITY_DN2152_c0_g1~~TRINITY_DN2152_c0_g1_i1.p1  ORF type:complete len:138 (-),score=42.99 TRINITY_DN2152_c0_g1_i1:66-479(-)
MKVNKTINKTVNLAVNGTLMRGLKLEKNMREAKANFIKEAKTMPAYKIWTINDEHPAMQRVKDGGAKVDVEVWKVPVDNLYKILVNEPAGLCIGKVKLDSNEEVLGVLGESVLCKGQKEITQHGGWRSYIETIEEEN